MNEQFVEREERKGGGKSEVLKWRVAEREARKTNRKEKVCSKESSKMQEGGGREEEERNGPGKTRNNGRTEVMKKMYGKKQNECGW